MLPKIFKPNNEYELIRIGSNNDGGYLVEKNSLFETALVSVNDKLVKFFLDNRIKYTDISKKMNIILTLKEFNKFKKYKVNKIEDIRNLNKRIEIKLNKIIK